jgi:DNA-binding transcriptional LysR family regulator
MAVEFFSSLMGSGVKFSAHSASKQSVLALVAAGFGITLATASQAMVSVPGVVVIPTAESNALVRTDLVWVPESEEPVVGRFISFFRDEARSRGLVNSTS